MARKKELPKKEVYRLWLEYLRRSRRFKSFCKWADKNNITWKTLNLRDPFPQKFCNFINIKGLKIFTSLFIPGIFLPFALADRESQSFDDAFCDEIKAFFDPLSIGENNLVFDFVELFDIWFDQLMEEYKKKGRKLTLEEVRRRFKWRLKNELILCIHSHPLISVEILGKIVMKHIKMRRQDPEYQARESVVFPLKPVFEEMKRYLQVYDQVEDIKKRGGNWEEVFIHFHTEIAKKLSEFETLSAKEYDKQLIRKESCLRILKRDYAYAKRIISNVEKGIFPGKYH